MSQKLIGPSVPSEPKYELIKKSWGARLLRRGYKYRLTEPYELVLYNTPLYHGTWHQNKLTKACIEISRVFDGPGFAHDIARPFRLRIEKGYCWDGVSGPTIDTPRNIPGSLPHDALYELSRAGLLEPGFRKWADQVARAVWERDEFRTPGLYYWVLRVFGGFAARRKKKK